MEANFGMLSSQLGLLLLAIAVLVAVGTVVCTAPDIRTTSIYGWAHSTREATKITRTRVDLADPSQGVPFRYRHSTAVGPQSMVDPPRWSHIEQLDSHLPIDLQVRELEIANVDDLVLPGFLGAMASLMLAAMIWRAYRSPRGLGLPWRRLESTPFPLDMAYGSQWVAMMGVTGEHEQTDPEGMTDLIHDDERAARSFLSLVAPPLDGMSKKGDAGRVGVLGGSKDYTGAPYYAGKSAVLVGCDLLYLFTAEEAANPIKSYSPELMVTPVYSAKWPDGRDAGVAAMVAAVERFLPRLTALVIGPGLGRDASVLEAVAQILSKVRGYDLPVVIDADGLWLINQRPEVVKGNPNVILTPNISEYNRLKSNVLGVEVDPARPPDEELKQLCQALGGVTICKKGVTDLISDGKNVMECSVEGSPKRCGGVGDLLAGSIGVVAGWAYQYNRSGTQKWAKGGPLMWAARSAAVLVKKASVLTFEVKKRSTTAPDILENLGVAFEFYCPADGFSTGVSLPEL